MSADNAWIKPVDAAPPSFLEGLAQGGYAAMCAAMSDAEHADCDDPECCGGAPALWADLGEIEQRAFMAFAAGVAVALDGAQPLQTVTPDAHGCASVGGPASTQGPFKPRNMIDVLTEREYPEVKDGAAAPSPGAAARQLCRSLDAAPNLKRLLEDMLSAQNRASHEFSRERDSRKRLELLANGFSGLFRQSVDGEVCRPDLRERARNLLLSFDILEETLSSAAPDSIRQLAVTLANWSAPE